MFNIVKMATRGVVTTLISKFIFFQSTPCGGAAREFDIRYCFEKHSTIFCSEYSNNNSDNTIKMGNE